MMVRARAWVAAAVFAVLAACTLLPVSAECAVNPFLSGKGGKQGTEQEDGRSAGVQSAPRSAYPTVLGPVMDKLARMQMEIRQRMTGFARDIKREPWGGAFWLMMLFSFMYGSLHALGPGHGKLFTASYFLNRPGGFRDALLFGNLTMFFHVLSATVLVMAGYYLFSGAGTTVDTMGTRLEVVSYSLLCLLGLGMTLFAVRDIRHGHGHGHGHGFGPGSGKDSDQSGAVTFRSLVTMAFAAGMIPCPGAALVLTFSLTLGIIGTGLLSMLSISLGMGLTTSATACLAICTRGLLLKAAENHARTWNILHGTLTLTGSLCITLLGAVMLLGALGRV